MSTTDQRPEIQFHALQAYAEAHGLKIAGEFKSPNETPMLLRQRL